MNGNLSDLLARSHVGNLVLATGGEAGRVLTDVDPAEMLIVATEVTLAVVRELPSTGRERPWASLTSFDTTTGVV